MWKKMGTGNGYSYQPMLHISYKAVLYLREMSILLEPEGQLIHL